MRLALVVPTLGPGGAERVMALLANHWAAKGFEVTLLTFDDGAEGPFYRLHPAVRYRPLGIAGASTGMLAAVGNNLRRIRILREAIHASAAQAVISFIVQTNVVTLLAARTLGVPVFAAEHADPYAALPPRAWRALRRLTYPGARAIVVLNERARGYFPRPIRRRVAVIPNPVLAPPPCGAEIGFRRPYVMGMGRFTEEKGFDLLLAAFARVTERHPDWRLVIAGDGPLRDRLESARRRLGLEGVVELPGVLGSPYAALRAADLFVLPSRTEGFPMALCEAMACGVAVIATEYNEGVHEIVHDGIDGVIVPRGDTAALAAAMDRLLGDARARARLGRRARDIVHRYSAERVFAHWEALLAAALRS